MSFGEKMKKIEYTNVAVGYESEAHEYEHNNYMPKPDFHPGVVEFPPNSIFELTLDNFKDMIFMDKASSFFHFLPSFCKPEDCFRSESDVFKNVVKDTFFLYIKCNHPLVISGKDYKLDFISIWVEKLKDFRVIGIKDPQEFSEVAGTLQIRPKSIPLDFNGNY